MATKRLSLTAILASNVRRLRERDHLSQVELAKITGIDRSNLNQLEGGRRTAALATIERLAKAFGVEGWELLKEH
jgi:transcriptional regulator with XRE-family HTH domain